MNFYDWEKYHFYEDKDQSGNLFYHQKKKISANFSSSKMMTNEAKITRLF